MSIESPSPIVLPFELPPGNSLYEQNSSADMKVLVERIYKTLCCSVRDDRDYRSGEVLKYLETHGAHLIENMTSLTATSKVSNGGGLSLAAGPYSSRSLEAILGSYNDEDESFKLFLYKGCFLRVIIRDSGTTIETTGPISLDVKAIHEELSSFLAPRQPAAVSVLLNAPHGMVTKSIDFIPPVIDDLDLNYGKGFTEKVHTKIVAKLGQNKPSLMLFHGHAGTGKSSYIKHLTTLTDREFIFVPVGMAGELSSPAFLNLLLSHENAILVLEDAEQALQARETDYHNSSTISTLLNLSDGLLGSLLNVTIIATYNADRQTIDKALLRKGRLSFDYTFDKLPTDCARRLATHLKKDPSQFTEPTSLADVYNAEDDTGYVAPVEKKMGFGFGGGVVTTPKE